MQRKAMMQKKVKEAWVATEEKWMRREVIAWRSWEMCGAPQEYPQEWPLGCGGDPGEGCWRLWFTPAKA